MEKYLMQKYIFVFYILFTINLSADLLDDTFKWYVNKEYKNTQTYI